MAHLEMNLYPRGNWPILRTLPKSNRSVRDACWK
ncbi:conserved hypothetical protein, partial [delta proteobacterium NaphS2]